MKKTKLILTRAAMMLFAMFVAQATWADNFFMHRATVYFQVGEREIVVEGSNKVDGFTLKDVNYGYHVQKVQTEGGQTLNTWAYPEDKLWVTFTGEEVAPKITKIIVPGRATNNDAHPLDRYFVIEADAEGNLPSWINITYKDNIYCKPLPKATPSGEGGIGTSTSFDITDILVGSEMENMEGPLMIIETTGDPSGDQTINLYDSEETVSAGVHFGRNFSEGQDVQHLSGQGKNQRPIGFAIKPMPLEITVTPKEAYANLYTVFPEGSEFAGQYARYYNGEALSMEDELDVVITTQLPEGYSYSNFSPSMAYDLENAEQDVVKVVGDYGWVKPYPSNDEDPFRVYYQVNESGVIHEAGHSKPIDMTYCYTPVMAGPDAFIRIVKVPVNLVISGNVEEVEFDGEEHSVDGFTVDQVTSAIEGLELSEEAARSIPAKVKVDDARAFRTNAGETYMEMNNARFDDDTYCVGEVTYNQGKIIVTPSDDEFIVKIAGNTLTKEWNDEEFTVNGYEQGIDDQNALASYFDVTKINFTGTDEATGKEVGKHYMGLAADQFEYTGENFSNVVFLVSDGYVEVVPRLTLVQISGNWTECYYNGAVHTSSGYEVYPFDERLDPSSIVCKLDEWAVQGTEVGEYYSHVTKDDFECTDPHFAPGYSIDQVMLKITYFPATLADNADNTKLIKELCNPMKHGLMATVTLDRTFVKDNTWNTICLPFDVTIADSPLAGADVREMSEAALEDGTLTLNFTEESLTEMKAGKAYIIKWTEGDDLVNPKFVGVEFNDVEEVEELMVEEPFDLGDDQSISFKGTFAPIAFEEDDASVLLVGDNNKLFYPLATATLAAQRAYFQLTGIEAGAPAAVVEEEEGGEGAPVFVLHFGGATNINNMSMDKAANEYFDLSGRRVVEPTKGIYIMNGKKVVIK